MLIGEGWELDAKGSEYTDFHWFHVPARGSLVLVVKCERPVTYLGHYVNGRMWPCTGEECSLCAEGVGRQARFVLGVVEPVTRRAGLLELGRGNGLQVRDWAERRGGLKGLMIELTKEGSSRQSRTVVRYVEDPEGPGTLAIVGPDLIKALFFTWRKAGMKAPPGMEEALSQRGL